MFGLNTYKMKGYADLFNANRQKIDAFLRSKGASDLLIQRFHARLANKKDVADRFKDCIMNDPANKAKLANFVVGTPAWNAETIRIASSVKVTVEFKNGHIILSIVGNTGRDVFPFIDMS